MAEEKAKKTSKKTTKKVAPAKKAAPKKVVVKKAPVKKAEAKKVKAVAPKKVAPTKKVVEEKAEEKTEKVIPSAKVPEFDLQELLEAGCHFGHKAAKWHPKMAEYIHGEQEGVHIFDLVKTVEQLTKAYQQVYELAKEGKSLLMVGTKRQAREIIRASASEAACYHITSRWMGGMLTNWNQINKSIKRMTDIEAGLKTGKFDKYTKYERLKLEKEQNKLQRFFSGVEGLTGKPDCIFVVDPEKESIVVKEANKENVPVIALADSNADPRPLSLVIPANDDAVKSIKYIVEQLAAAYSAGKADRK